MKKAILLTLICAIFSSLICYSQPVITWQKTYGGSGHEYAYKSIQTSDGGYAFVGSSESNDGDVSNHHGTTTNNDLWVCKIDASGVIQWSKLYGGSEDDEGLDLIQTSDGGFIVAGWTDSNDGDVTGHHGTYNSDIWVLKLTSTGTIDWNKCFGGTSDDEANEIAMNQNGDFYIFGTTYSSNGDISGLHGTNSDMWAIKINSTGTLLGQKCIGGADYEEGINMSLTSDGGCIICGRSSSTDGDAIGAHGGSDMLIAKLSSSMVVEWSKCYGGTQTEECNSIVQLTDGSYVALGYTSTQNNGDVTGHHGSQGSDDFWLLKLTSTGTITWAKCFGGSGDDQANGLTKSSDGGFVMSGLTNSMDGDVTGFHVGDYSPDVWIAKVNSDGTLQWQRSCGGSTQDENFNVLALNDGTFMSTSFTYSNDADVSGNHGSADAWIFKINGSTFINDISNNVNISVYPNPNKGTFSISSDIQYSAIQITDILGKIIYTVKATSLQSEICIPNPSKGVYFCKIIDDQGETIKVEKLFIH